eukprot:scaffold32894_cov154-Skeletonema_menzelii.AAC.6
MSLQSQQQHRPASKRGHASISASQASSELMASLSSSLHELLCHHPTDDPSQWLQDAMSRVGVSSNVAALKLWSEFGRENDEQFCDARYLVWVCQHVLFHTNNNHQQQQPAAVSSSLDVLQSWQQSMEALINNSEAENDNNEMGVMWQMLLHCLNLTPQQLRSAYRKALEYNPHIRNIDDISYCFMWPSFFKAVVDEASGNQNNNNHHANKRRKSQHGNYNNQQQQQQSNLANTAWWPLFGYSITHAILSNNNQTTNTFQQKIQQLQSAIMESLPSIMGIPCFDFVKKHSLLSGVVACILDVVGEGLVLGTLSLDEDEVEEGGTIGGGGGGGGVRMMIGGEEAGTLGILEVEVGQIVDLLLLSSG